MSSPAAAAVAEPKKRKLGSKYYSIAKYKHSQHLDYEAEIGKRIQENRHFFEDFIDALAARLQQHEVRDCSEIDEAVKHIEIAKDAIGRALIHSIGKVNGVPFKDAFEQAYCESDKPREEAK